MTLCSNGKKERKGDTALLIQGARRVGESTIAEEFARNEYKSYILIDFSKVSKEVSDLFNDIKQGVMVGHMRIKILH